MTAVTIPARLDDELSLHPDRFRPKVPVGADVIVLVCSASAHEHVGLVGVNRGEPPIDHLHAADMLIVDVGDEHDENGECWAYAWAPVGDGCFGATAEPGDRVLVLAGDDDAIGQVCVRSGKTVGTGPNIVVLDQRVELLATRWAVLPPAGPAAEPEPQQRPVRRVANGDDLSRALADVERLKAELDAAVDARDTAKADALREMSEALVKHRDTLPGQTPKQSGRRLGIEEAASRCRASADQYEAGTE